MPSHDLQISATHRYGYHPGEWFEVLGVAWHKDRACFVVDIENGRIDFWPIQDPSDSYNFRKREP